MPSIRLTPHEAVGHRTSQTYEDFTVLPIRSRHDNVALDNVKERTIAPFRGSTSQASDIPPSLISEVKHQQINASKHNDSQSRLLKLPAELRSQIWEFVLGARTIHVESWRDSEPHDQQSCHKTWTATENIKWNIFPCFSRRSANELYYLSTQPIDLELGIPSGLTYSKHWTVIDETWTPQQWKEAPAQMRQWQTCRMRTWLNSHGSCTHRQHNSAHAHDPDSLLQDFEDTLTFIMTCKRIFTEGRDTFFRLNTFSFHESLSLTRFLRLHDLRQLSLIRSLDLKISVHECIEPFDNTASWISVFNSYWLRRLCALSRIHIYIKQEEQGWDPRDELGLQAFREKIAQALQRLNLKHVTVIVENLPGANGRDSENLQMAGMRHRHDLGRKWAFSMQTKILGRK